MSTSFRSNMYLYYCEGTIICITNSILLFCILANTKNRNRREFLLIAAQAIADDLYAISFILVAELRLRLADEGRENGNSTVWVCALEPALPIHDLSTPLLGLLPLATSLNFLVCTVAPFFYLRAGKGYTTVLIGSPYLISFILLFVNYAMIWEDETLTSSLCVATKGAAHPVVYGIMRLLRVMSTFVSAIIYGFILAYLRKKRPQPSEVQRMNHRNTTITLGLVTINSMFLLFIPDVIMFINPFNILANYSTLLYSMTLSKTMINFFIYMWRYRELRLIVIASTCGKSRFFRSLVSTHMLSQAGASQMRPEGTTTVRKSLDMLQTQMMRRTSVVMPRFGEVRANSLKPGDVTSVTRSLPPLRVPRPALFD